MMNKASSSTHPPPSDSESEFSSSSEDVTEDEEGDELTPALDAAILQTLGRIKRKEGVYGEERVLDEALKEAEKKAGGLNVVKRTVADKPYLLVDHHRAALLSGQTGEEDEEPAPLTNVQADRLLRANAINAFKSLAHDDDDDEMSDGEEYAGFVLKPRGKDEDETAKEDAEYRRFLLEIGGGEEQVRKILGMGDQPVSWSPDEEVQMNEEGETGKALSKVERKEFKAEKKAKKEKKGQEDDEFLMNYILNRGWIDRSKDHVPRYTEIVGKDDDEEVEVEVDDEENQAGPSHPWGVLEEDEYDEKAEKFETAYNFRFEEPGAAEISIHPRNISTLVRRPDDARSAKRAAKAERKAAARGAAEEETRRLKGKRRREMESQLASLKDALGENVDWDALEKVMDGEWDESEWEKVVGGMLARAGEEEDEGKPVWNDDLGDEYDEEGDGGAEHGGDDIYGGGMEGDDGPINMDADFIDEQPSEKRKKNRKGKPRAENLESLDEPEDLTVADRAVKVKEAMEEYHALDHEDMIGDMPTRFKYTRTAPLDLGLTPAEILLASDTELNALAGVKHIATYRRGGMGRAGFGLGKRVGELKNELKGRRWGEEGDMNGLGGRGHGGGGGSGANGITVKRRGESSAGGDGTQARKTKRLGKKQRERAKAAAEAGGADVANVGNGGGAGGVEEGDGGGGGGGEKKRRKKKKSKYGEKTPLEIYG